MDEVWTVVPRRGGVEVTLTAGPPHPLVARLTAAELSAAEQAMAGVAESVRRGEFSRPRLGQAFRDAIGRDPFRRRKTVEPGPLWPGLAGTVVGFSFASHHSEVLWLRLAGYGVGLAALGDLAAQVWRRIARRRDGARES
ncbi:hypothetical protein Ade02nite_68500 [Paractinoplanes deccanensis]|uniref:Uncharacterized protein n=1 Tax=Paractinoplanes deccanensis TaxID=113561 RepID=A0ABQ3YDY5_9ACTN|nr:hypothetical protein [Actinoplanes deccanensis]GID78209.1 hypothetical protein Ade02nite_68500 [Actinoplanes deccanensis]